MWLLFKMSIAKIRKSIGRFLSILLIVALGVGFFAGLRETAPDILTTLDDYYDRTSLMDFKIMSTMGLTDDDIASLSELSHVERVVPSYSVDGLVDGRAVRIHTLEEDINQVELIDGRQIENANECLADSSHYQVGDTIHISELTVDGMLEIMDYEVVGTVQSSLYIGTDMGITQIGKGKIESFLFVDKDNFHSDYYTEVYLTAKGTLDAISYQEDYRRFADALEDELLTLKPIRETIRYEEILKEATEAIQEIEDALQEEVADAQKELDQAKAELDQTRQTLDQSRDELEQARATLQEKERSGKQALEEAEATWQSSYQAYITALQQYGITEDSLDTFYDQISSQVSRMELLLESTSPDDPNYEMYLKQLQTLQLQQSGLETLIDSRGQLREGRNTLDEQKQAFDTEIGNAYQEIERGESSLASGENAWQEGYASYQAGVIEFNQQVDDANRKIADARAELETIEKPQWYVLDRSDNSGYISIWEDAQKVDSIAQVFPVFFILVVALMCFNTMNRMIEEERGEIGVLSSLGYSNGKIIGGYIFYVFFATFIGASVGLLAGYTIIPTVIYQIYHANYLLPPLVITVKWVPFTILVGCSFTLMVLITYLSCRKELRSFPAMLLRPKAPKMGKKVLLERIPFLWKRFSFTWKVTIRNLFRYKKRVIMTILGIAGCSALLLTGFGLRDSINQLVDLQYGNIIRYDALFVFQDAFTTVDDTTKEALQADGISEMMPIYQESFTFEAKGLTHDVYLMVLSNPLLLDDYVSLRTYDTKEDVSLSSGVAITQKMAQLLDVKAGDLIPIRNSQNELFFLPVTSIVENYTLHYIYMSPDDYKRIFESDPSYNILMTNFEEDQEIDFDAISTEWIESGRVSTVSFTEENIETFDTMIQGLNSIVYLIIVASCLLAYIVLYNLTTINITERIREISTLKVLGFYDKEVSSYVYRETLILTVIGILVGLVLGIFLHSYVMAVAETDNILFLRSIHWISFILSFVITIFFGILVQIFMHFKLKRIDMIESLKSVE